MLLSLLQGGHLNQISRVLNVNAVRLSRVEQVLYQARLLYKQALLVLNDLVEMDHVRVPDNVVHRTRDWFPRIGAFRRFGSLLLRSYRVDLE